MKSTKEGWNFSFQVGLWPHWHPPYGVVDEILSISCVGDKHFSPEQRVGVEEKRNGLCYFGPPDPTSVLSHSALSPEKLTYMNCSLYVLPFWILISFGKWNKLGDWKKTIQVKSIFLCNPPSKLPCRLVVYFYPKPQLMQTALVHIILLPRSGNCSQSWSLMGFQLLLALGHHTTSLQSSLNSLHTLKKSIPY